MLYFHIYLLFTNILIIIIFFVHKGPKDLEKGEVRAVLRCNSEKRQIKQVGLADTITEMLVEVHDLMY